MLCEVSVRANTQRPSQIIQIRQNLVLLSIFRGKSCKFIPQKVGLAHILMDEDVIQIYKNKTKAQIKKEKVGAEQPAEPKKVERGKKKK